MYISGRVFASEGCRLLAHSCSLARQTSAPAACRARRASAHSPRCHATQSARWHSFEQYRARGPRAGQLPHRLRCFCSPAVCAASPGDVMPHVPQHRRRSTDTVSAKSGSSRPRRLAMWSAVSNAVPWGDTRANVLA